MFVVIFKMLKFSFNFCHENINFGSSRNWNQRRIAWTVSYMINIYHLISSRSILPTILCRDGGNASSSDVKVSTVAFTVKSSALDERRVASGPATTFKNRLFNLRPDYNRWSSAVNLYCQTNSPERGTGAFRGRDVFRFCN